MQQSIEVTARLLRDWPLPVAGGSKYSRGQVVVIGGCRRTPGAAILAGLGALRVGAGRLTLAVADSVAASVATALPESGVVSLGETASRHIDGATLDLAQADLQSADAVLVGPGLDDPAEAEAILTGVLEIMPNDAVLVVDAFALGVLSNIGSHVDRLRGRLVLTPNSQEAEYLLHRGLDTELDDANAMARRYGAAVSYGNSVAGYDGRLWSLSSGNSGLGTSGSGDVLAGAIAGLCARGAPPDQAAVWATWAHGAAGDRLADTVAPLGFLASEVADALPAVLGSVG